MSNKTLKDTLIDLYHSGDLVLVWHDGDKRQCGDMSLSDAGMLSVTMWFMQYDDDIVAETLCDRGPEMAAYIAPWFIDDLGSYVYHRIEATAIDWVKNCSEWEQAKAHIAELENSND